MRAIGINTWVWTSPLTDANLPGLLRHDRRARLRRRRAAAREGRPPRPRDDRQGAPRHRPHAVRRRRDGARAATWSARTRPPSAATQDYLRACVDLAAAVGATRVCGPFYAATGRTWRMTGSRARRGVRRAARTNLAPVVEHAAAAGVVVGIEPLNRYETSLVNTVDQALAALEAAARAGTSAWPSTPTTSTSRSARAPTPYAAPASTSCTSRSAAATAAPRVTTRPTGRRCSRRWTRSTTTVP